MGRSEAPGKNTEAETVETVETCQCERTTLIDCNVILL